MNKIWTVRKHYSDNAYGVYCNITLEFQGEKMSEKEAEAICDRLNGDKPEIEDGL